MFTVDVKQQHNNNNNNRFLQENSLFDIDITDFPIIYSFYVAKHF